MKKKKAYVVGTNVSKSLSPLIFNYWFKKYNVKAKYSFVEVKEKDFDSEMCDKILSLIWSKISFLFLNPSLLWSR